MNDKKGLSILLMLVFAGVLGYLVFAEGLTLSGFDSLDLNRTIFDASPASGSNNSGNINLSVMVNSTANIANVSFMWQLISNNSFMRNITYHNTTADHGYANQSMFGNHSGGKYNFNTSSLNTTTGLPDGIYNLSIYYCNISTENSAMSCAVNSTFRTWITIDNTIPAVSPIPLPPGMNLFSISTYNVTFNASIKDLTIQTAAGVFAPGLVIFHFDNATGNDFNVTPENKSGYWSYSFNVSSLHAGDQLIKIFANDTASRGGNNSNITQTIIFNVNTPHNVTWQTNDGDGWGFLSYNQTFNITIGNRIANKTNYPIEYVIFQFDNASKTGSMNITNTSEAADGYFWRIGVNVSKFPVGTHTVKIFANDSLGHTNATESITFAINNSAHNVTWQTSDGDGWGFLSYNQTFNITIGNRIENKTDARITDVIFQFDNASKTGSMNITNTSGAADGYFWRIGVNVSKFPVGTHTVKIFANDSLGHYNNTETIIFAINNTPQNVTWDASYGTVTKEVRHGLLQSQNFSAKNSTVFFNVSIYNLTDAAPFAVIFMFDNATGTDFNLTNGTNVVAGQYWNVSYNMSALQEGNHTITVFVNNSLGHFNKTEKISFFVDKTAPSVTVSCTPSAATVGNTVTCSCSAVETDGNSSGIKTSARFSGSSSSTESTTASGTSGNSQTCYAEDFAGNSGTGTGSWTVTAASSGGSGGGGSGGGTSSGVTGTFAKEVWTSINAGETAKVEVTNGAIGITEVSFSVADTTYGAWLKVEKKDSLPSDVQSFSGKVYKNVEITENNVKKALSGTAKIEFKVTKVWLSENGLGKDDVAMHRYAEGKWNELKTTVGEDDGTSQHYTAETPGFSYFVIGQKAGAVAGPAKEAAEKVAGEKAAAGEEAAGEDAAVGEEVVAGEGKGIWTWIIVVLVIIALVAIAFWLKKRQ